MENEDSPKDEAKNHDKDVDKAKSDPGLDEDPAEEAPVRRVGLQQEQPEVGQEGSRTEETCREDRSREDLGQRRHGKVTVEERISET